MKRYRSSEWHQRPYVGPSFWRGIAWGLAIEVAVAFVVFAIWVLAVTVGLALLPGAK